MAARAARTLQPTRLQIRKRKDITSIYFIVLGIQKLEVLPEISLLTNSYRQVYII